MNQKFLSLFLILSVYACFANTHLQTIKIENNTNQDVELKINLVERAAAVITMTKLKSAQEMLHRAILDDSAEGIKEAILAGANINLEKDGKSPLLLAVLLKRNNAIDTLFKFGARANAAIATYAVKNCNTKLILHILKQNHVKIKSEQIENIILRVQNYNDALDLIMALVNGGCNINEIWQTAILLDSYNPLSNQIAVKFLLSHGANPNHVDTRNSVQRFTPLQYCLFYPNKNVAKTIIEAGANLNQKVFPMGSPTASCTLLSFAININKNELIELLLEYGASL